MPEPRKEPRTRIVSAAIRESVYERIVEDADRRDTNVSECIRSCLNAKYRAPTPSDESKAA